MVRHKAFPSQLSLCSFIRERVPSDVYHSCAFYENPDAEMDQKGWSGADLVFDIDADHIPTTCGKLHDEWRCSNEDCGRSGSGVTPDFCHKCGGVKFSVKTWACKECIDTTRLETHKLIDFLTNDFGFSETELHTFFSGHRGYHIYVENDAARSLDAVARKEIVDYVTGIGLSMFSKKQRAKTSPKRKPTSSDFKLNNYGWSGRIKKALKRFVEDASIYDLAQAGLNKASIDLISENREAIIRYCIEENRWDAVKGLGYETWMRFAQYIRDMQIADIDTVVTSDVHRLIRASGTLHGKTGLLKMEFPLKDLDKFDPFEGAVAFKEGTANVQVSNAPEFELNGQYFGPFRCESVELPTAAAVLLILKGRAELVN